MPGIGIPVMSLAQARNRMQVPSGGMSISRPGMAKHRNRAQAGPYALFGQAAEGERGIWVVPEREWECRRSLRHCPASRCKGRLRSSSCGTYTNIERSRSGTARFPFVRRCWESSCTAPRSCDLCRGPSRPSGRPCRRNSSGATESQSPPANLFGQIETGNGPRLNHVRQVVVDAYHSGLGAAPEHLPPARETPMGSPRER